MAEDTKDRAATIESIAEVFRRAQERDELINIKKLPNGTEFNLITNFNNVYTIRVIDNEKKLVLLQGLDGLFKNAREVKLLGATIGSSSAIALDVVGKGFCVELVVLESHEVVRTGGFVKEIVLKKEGKKEAN